MRTEQEIRASFVEQAGYCKNLGSPFTHDVLLAMVDALERGFSIGTGIPRRRQMLWPCAWLAGFMRSALANAMLLSRNGFLKQ